MGSAHLCSYCAFATDDPWEMLFHRDTHRDHPAVIEGTKRVNAVLAAVTERTDRGTE